MSCASPGNCGAGGAYADNSGHVQAFVMAQTSGRWGTAEEVPGIAALNKAGDAGVNASELSQAFVVSKT